jgi:hypothetical protein
VFALVLVVALVVVIVVEMTAEEMKEAVHDGSNLEVLEKVVHFVVIVDLDPLVRIALVLHFGNCHVMVSGVRRHLVVPLMVPLMV